MPYKDKRDRKYTVQAAYNAEPQHIKERDARNAARRTLMKTGAVRVGDGKDVDHIVPISKGGTNVAGNLRAVSVKRNRTFDRDANHALVSNKAPRK